MLLGGGLLSPIAFLVIIYTLSNASKQGDKASQKSIKI